MAIITKYAANATVVTSTWGTPANATGSTTGNYATWAVTTANGTGTLDLDGFNFSADIPSNAIINNVTVTVRQHVTATARFLAPQVQVMDGATNIGSVQTLLLTTTTTNEDIFTVTPTVTQLRSSTFKVRFTGRRSSQTTAATQNLDLVKIDVDFTDPTVITQSLSGMGVLTASAGQGPKYIQDAASINDIAATTITTNIKATTSGNLLIAAIAMRTGDNVLLNSVTDSSGGTWSLAGADFQGTSSSRIEVWYRLSATSITSVTATFASAIKAGMNISEYSGLSSIDTVITGEDTDARVEVPITLVEPGLAFAALNSTTGTSADRTIDTTTGFFELIPFHTTTGSNANGDAAYRIVSTAGTYTAAWDDIAIRNSGFVGVGFKAVAIGNNNNVALTGSGTLTATGSPNKINSVSLTGSGTLTATGIASSNSGLATITHNGTPTMGEAGSGALSADIAYPSGIVANEVLILAITVSSAGVTTIPPATGWILANANQNTSGGTASTAIFYKVATGSETGSLTVNAYAGTGTAQETSGGRITLQMYRFSGVDTGTVIEGTGANSGSGNATSYTHPATTTTTNGAVVLYAIGLNHSAGTNRIVTAVSGITKIGSGPTANVGREGQTFMEPRATAGSTGTRLFTNGGASLQWGGTSTVLKPGPLGGGGTNSAVFAGEGTLSANGIQTGVIPTLVHRIVGVPGTTSTTVSIRTNNAASVRLKASTDSAGNTGVVYGSPVTPSALGDAKLPISGLTPGTHYYYRVAMTNSSGTESLDTNSVIGRLRTAPIGQTNFAFNFGSCTVQSDSASFTAIAARNDDLFFHLGDLYYADGSGTGIENFRTKFNAKITATNHAAVFATTPTNYTPSDHDGMNNNGANGNDPTAWANWRTVYNELFPAPATYYSFMYGRVLFIQIDDRNFKSATALVDNSSKTALGITQKQWLKDEITNTTAKAIVIAQSGPWVGAGGDGEDGWSGFTTERTELANFFSASGKPIVMLGGDMHAITADNGTNAPGGITVFHAAPFINIASHKGGPYSSPYYPTSEGGSNIQQYGHVAVTDTGTQISFAFTGYSSDNTARLSVTKNFTVTADSVNYTGSALLAGSGTLTAVGVKQAVIGSATLTGNGNLSAVAYRTETLSIRTLIETYEISADASGNYVAPNDSDKVAMQGIWNKVKTGDLAGAHTDATTFNYEVILVSDTETSRQYAVLHEKPTKNRWWGFYIWNRVASPAARIVCQVHTGADTATEIQSADLFIRSNAKAFLGTGTHRNASSFLDTDGDNITDVANADSSVFQSIYEQTVIASDRTWEPHGFPSIEPMGSAHRVASSSVVLDPAGTSLTVPLPDGTRFQERPLKIGDSAFVLLTVRDTAATYSAPSGWTEISKSVENTGIQTIVFRKEMTLGDITGSGFTFSWSTSHKSNAILVAYESCGVAEVINAVETSGTTVTPHTIGPITPTVANTVLLSFFTATNGTAWTTASTTTDEIIQARTSATDSSSSVAYDTDNAVQPIAPYSVTANNPTASGNVCMHLLALRPAGTVRTTEIVLSHGATVGGVPPAHVTQARDALAGKGYNVVANDGTWTYFAAGNRQGIYARSISAEFLHVEQVLSIRSNSTKREEVNTTLITPTVTSTVEAFLTGSGTLTAIGSPNKFRSVALTGAGTLTVQTSIAVPVNVSLTGSGSLTSAPGTVGRTGTSALTGSGTLTATALVPTFIRSTASVTETAATTISTSFPQASVTGNLILVAIAMRTGQSVSLLSVTDIANNNWQFAGADYRDGASSRIEVWYCLNATSTTTITATFASAIKAGMNISEYSGLTVIDNVITGDDADNQIVVPITVSGAGLAYTAINASSGTQTDRTLDPAGGFTRLPSFFTAGTSNINGDAAYRIVSTAGTYTATWNDTTIRNSGFVGVGFKPSGTQNKPLGSTVALRTTTIPGPVPLTYWSNDILGTPNNAVQRVVFVIHGTGGNAQGYAEYILGGAALKSVVPSTLVVSPHFMQIEDSPTGMYWPSGWREGANSLDASNLSSFTVLDSLINSVDTSIYPNLKEIVVAGHSAGGQFVTRWAAGSTTTKVNRIVAANAGSYMYFDATRPYSTSGATGYNDYKYGTDNRSSIPYMAAPTIQQLKDRFAAKKMVVLLGELDNVRDADLDISPEADTQGLNRFERGTEFFNAHFLRVFGPNIYTNHFRTTVPNIGHSGSGMFGSPEGAAALFDPQELVPFTGIGTLTVVSSSVTSYTGSATLSGSGTLSTTVGIVSRTGTVNLTGSGTLTVTGSPNKFRSVALTGAGTLTVQTSIAVPVNVSLTGSGSLTTTINIVTRTGSATLTGSGTLTAIGSSAIASTANLTGSGTLSTTVGVITRTGTVNLTGSGTLISAVSGLSVISSAALTGSGTLGTQTGVSGTGSASLSGLGTLSTTIGAVNRTGSATLSSTGQLTAVASTVTASRAVTLTGSGTLSSTAIIVTIGAASLSGSGTLSSVTVPATSRATALTGSGTLTLNAAGIALTGIATLSGSGTLASVATGMFHSRTVSLSGTGTLTPSTSTAGATSANLSGAGTLSITVNTVNRTGFVSLAGSGTLSSSTVISASRSASFTGTGVLTSTSSSLIITTCSLTGSGVLTASTNSGSAGNAVLTGSGSLSTVVNTSIIQVSTFTGLGTLNAVTSAIAQQASVSFTGSGTLNTQTAGSGSGTANLSGLGTLTSSTQTQILRSAGFTGSGTLSSVAIITLVAQISLTGSGTLSATGQQIIARTIELTGTGALTTSATTKVIRNIGVTGTGTLTANSTNLSVTRTVALTGSGALTAVSIGVHQTATANFSGSGTIGFQTGTSGTATLNLSGTGTLVAVGISQITKTVAFTGSGTSSTATNLSIQVISTFNGSGTISAEVEPALNRITVLSGIGTLTTSRSLSINIERNLSGNGTLTINTVVNPRIIPGTLELLTIKMNSRQYNGTIIPNRFTGSITRKSYPKG